MHHLKILFSGLVMAFLVAALIAAPATRAEPADNSWNNLRYPQKLWDPQVLRILIEGPGYLDPSLEFNLSPPPANNSKTTTDELTLLATHARQDRTKATLTLIRKEAAIGDFVDIYLNTPDIAPALAKAASHLLHLADKECRYFVVNYKKRFARPRPSHLNPSLDLVVPNPGHAAYPSGHATQSMLYSKILALIDPEKESHYLSYAAAIAHRREIAGVHYPSDSKAGQQLAAGILAELQKLQIFQKELELARREFSAGKNPR